MRFSLLFAVSIGIALLSIRQCGRVPRPKPIAKPPVPRPRPPPLKRKATKAPTIRNYAAVAGRPSVGTQTTLTGAYGSGGPQVAVVGAYGFTPGAAATKTAAGGTATISLKELETIQRNRPLLGATDEIVVVRQGTSAQGSTQKKLTAIVDDLHAAGTSLTKKPVSSSSSVAIIDDVAQPPPGGGVGGQITKLTPKVIRVPSSSSSSSSVKVLGEKQVVTPRKTGYIPPQPKVVNSHAPDWYRYQELEKEGGK